jgi:hypothetical protein
MAKASAQWRFNVTPKDACHDLCFDAPPWTTGKLEANVDVEAITGAITRLAAALRTEVEARVELDARVTAVGGRAEEAYRAAAQSFTNVGGAGKDADACGGAAQTDAGRTAVHREGDIRNLHSDLQEVNRHVQRLEEDMLYHKQQQEQMSRAADEVLLLQLDAMRRDIDSRVRSCDLGQHADALLSQVRDLVGVESRSAAQAAIADDVGCLHAGISKVSEALGERQRLLEVRLEDLAARARVVPAPDLGELGLGPRLLHLESRVDELAAQAGTAATNEVSGERQHLLEVPFEKLEAAGAEAAACLQGLEDLAARPALGPKQR